MNRPSLIAPLLLIALVLTACKPGPPAPVPEGSITNYDVRGIVLSLKPEEKEVVIRHEEIPGYMAAMTMPFEVRDTNELNSLKPGDGVQFRLRVTEKDGWIDHVKIFSNAPPAATVAVPTAAPAPTNETPAFRILPKVADLKPGDLVPDYVFTNQLGKEFSLASLRGQAVAVTFIFTRCPFPLFCPRMSEHFGQVQKLLTNRQDAPANWQLVSLSIDPDFDTPATMLAYGKRWHADPAHWTLATGSMDQIEPFGTSTGLYFSRDVNIANFNHNLRTVVIDPDRRLRQVFTGNQWTPEELAEVLVAAARSQK